jgi:Rad3-related DNA helicase
MPSSSHLLLLLVLQVSEGLDFTDRAGRGVVLTGIPFANIGDPLVSSKCCFMPACTNTFKYACECHRSRELARLLELGK